MNTPEFIRVGGVLYRARRMQAPVPEQQVRYKGSTYKQAAEPHVQTNASNAIVVLQRILHDANVGEGAIQQLVALREALMARNYPIAVRLWASIQPSVLSLVDELDGGLRNQFGRAALELDSSLTNLDKTTGPREAAAPLPSYVTVDGHLYRLRK
jgi:hypothetical protein